MAYGAEVVRTEDPCPYCMTPQTLVIAWWDEKELPSRGTYIQDIAHTQSQCIEQSARLRTAGFEGLKTRAASNR